MTVHRPRGRLILFAAGAALLLSVLNGCMPAEIDQGQRVIPEEITVVMGGSSYTLNPYSSALANRRIGHLVFSGLTRIGYDLEPEPDLLAELPTKGNGGISADGRTVAYRLKEGLKWHDGQPVTAADVAFTLDQLRTGRLADDPEVDYSNIADVRVDGDLMLTVTLKRPDAPSAWRFAPFVLPKHKLGAETDVFSSGFWSAPVGSGPYRFVSGVAGEEVRLQPQRSDGTPLRVVFGRTADEQRARFDDVGDAVAWVDGPEAGAASESVVETASTVWQTWLMNASTGHETSDRALRRTLNEVLPIDVTVDPAKSDPWGNALPNRSTLSTAQAAAALDAAGWRRTGITRSKDGTRADLTIASPTLLAETDLFVLGVVDKLKGAGLRAGTSVTPSLGQGGLFDIDPLSTGSFDIARTTLALGAPYTVGWPFEPGDEPSIKNPNGSNVTRLEDSAVAKAIAAVRASGDPAEAAAGMRRLGELLQRTDTVLWDGQLPARLLTIGVNNVEAHPLPEYALFSAPYWSIDGATTEP